MASKTTNYGLNKHSPQDFYNVEARNENWDKIDEALAATDPTKITAKAEPADGDGVMIADSADGGKAKRLLWSSVKEALGKLFVPLTRKVNGKALSADVTLTAADIKMPNSEEDVGAAMAKYPNQMSGGQQQRIAIARSLLLKPSLLLLDEPFSALDAKIRQQMREELKKIQSDLGITVIFVTHDQEEAMALSHRIVVMNKGKFDQVGTPGEIYDSPATLHVASFIGEMNFIRNGGSTIAVRPEDIVVNKGHGPMEAVVRTIMMLGHYVVLTVQRGNEIIKCYVDRELSDQLREGDLVNLTIGKHTVFSQAA